MQRLLLVLLMTTGAISLSGCGFFNRNSDVTEDPTTPTESIVQPVETSDGELPEIPEGDDSDSVVAASPNSPTVVARDLIQSTDPNERTIGVERTRNDPFAELTIPLVPPQPIEPESNGATVQASPANAGTAAPGTVQAAANNAANTNGQGRPSLEARQVESGLPEISALPEIPQPTTARAVRVSGVLQIGGSPYAIVKAPNEIERYVRQGERIAGGSVVVKRIDTRSAEPRVILVENGIEVERLVTANEDGPTEEAPPSPTTNTVSTLGTLPVLPSPGI
ncbi:MAG: hypothetical protein AAGF93_11305 [Cyanobacteria bacterium P01_H01_bin.105]